MKRDIDRILGFLKNNLWLHLFVLGLFFTSLYFPQTLVMNESVETIAVFEIDASLMIDSVFQHLKTYNFQLGYMSRYYGWSYFFINYITLKPLDVLSGVLHYGFPVSYKIFLVKAVYFVISLSSLTALYFLIAKVFKNYLTAFVLSLLFLYPALKANLFVDIKPETTGLLFLFLSQISLIHFIQAKKERLAFWYGSGLLFAILSVMAKQSFLFAALPVLFLFLCYYAIKHRLNIFQYVKSQDFLKAMVKSAIFAGAIVFTIYPHLIIHPKAFIAFQLALAKDHSGGALTLKGVALFETWARVIWDNLFLKIITILWPISLASAIFYKKKLRLFFIVTVLAIPAIAVILCMNSALFIDTNYLHPLLSYFLISAALPFAVLYSTGLRWLKLLTLIIAGYLIFMLVSFSFFSVSNAMRERAEYKQSIGFKIKEFITEKIPTGSKLAVSQGVLIPSDNGLSYQNCHWWSSCGLAAQLDEFAPDYFIFIENESYNGVTPEFYLNFERYIEQHSFEYVDSIGKFVIYRKPASATIPL